MILFITHFSANQIGYSIWKRILQLYTRHRFYYQIYIYIEIMNLIHTILLRIN